MRKPDAMATLGDARAASKKAPKTEVVELELGHEFFRYQCGHLIAYTNRGVTLGRKEDQADVMVEVTT